jgi:hypothetical protein
MSKGMFFIDLYLITPVKNQCSELDDILVCKAQVQDLWVPEILARKFRKFWHVLSSTAIPLPD